MFNFSKDKNYNITYQLGDIFSVSPDNYQTLRAFVEFSEPVNGITKFYLLGNFKLILAENHHSKDQYDVYLPVGTLHNAVGSRVLLEGKTSFWSAHLPAVQEAMGEIYYRLLDVSGTLDPFIVIYRGPEVIIFIKTHGVPKNLVYTQTMPRRVHPDLISVTRHAVTVEPINTPAPIPSKEKVGVK
ncbi:MAG: hypothetical protein ACKOW9_00255 [Candidatus Paceibacterota bacterium]